MKKLIDMTPFELGECGRKEAVEYLIMYLSKGKPNDKRLAASAIGKLSAAHRESCRKAVPFLIENLSDSHGQVRQYTLKALSKLDIPKEYHGEIAKIAKGDTAEYNQRAAQEVLDNLKTDIYELPKVECKKGIEEDKYSNSRSFEENFLVQNIGAKEKQFIDILNKQCGIKLTEKQKAAVLHRDGPALVLAVPGAGKTTVLLSRTANLIINCGINPASILSITFSKASAIDMRNRYYSFFSEITSIGANFSTIHSFCYELIRKYSTMKNISFRIIEEGSAKGEKRLILKSLFKKYNGENLDEDALDDLINAIGYVKNMMLADDELKTYAESQDVKNFLQIFEGYEEVKRKNRYIDYDDMLTLSYDILNSDVDILNRYRSLYKYIQIDEGQDTSKVQHKIIELIAKPNNNVFIVADDDQSIYSFRGAYPRFLMEFEENYKGAHKYFIEQNFRSTPQIVNLANRFIKTNLIRFNKELHTENPYGGIVKTVQLKDEILEVEYILNQIEAAHMKDSVILYRNNMAAIKLADELSRRSFPFYIRDYNRFFFKHFVVEDIRNFILFTLNYSDIEAFNRIYYRVNSFISKETALTINRGNIGKEVFTVGEALQDISDSQKGALRRMNKIFDMLKLKTPCEFIDYIDKDLNYNKYLKENASSIGYSYESLRAVLSNLKSLTGRCSTFASFLVRLEELEKVLEESKFKKGKANITLSTIHSSKGLEFNNVFLIDLIDNIMPTRSSIESFEEGSFEELEEERRLMYVALTRAKKNLHIITLENKNDESVKPSRFITEIMKIDRMG